MEATMTKMDRSAAELLEFIPSGLEPADYVLLAILCLDQAGVSSLQQERILVKVREHLESVGVL
jgi:hypothetical protein